MEVGTTKQGGIDGEQKDWTPFMLLLLPVPRQLCGDKPLPVMVFLHGGGFFMGNPDMAGGSPLPMLTKDVVLVAPQYRLGTLGEVMCLVFSLSFASLSVLLSFSQPLVEAP